MSDPKTQSTTTTPPPPPPKATSTNPPPSKAKDEEGALRGDNAGKAIVLGRVEAKGEVTVKVRNTTQVPLRLAGIVDVIESPTSTVRKSVQIDISPGGTAEVPPAVFTSVDVMNMRKNGEIIIVK